MIAQCSIKIIHFIQARVLSWTLLSSILIAYLCAHRIPPVLFVNVRDIFEQKLKKNKTSGIILCTEHYLDMFLLFTIELANSYLWCIFSSQLSMKSKCCFKYLCLTSISNLWEALILIEKHSVLCPKPMVDIYQNSWASICMTLKCWMLRPEKANLMMLNN